MSDVYFITGATGFIGHKLVRSLVDSGATVRCLARPQSKREALRELGVEFIDGDLNDQNALRRGAEGASCIFHLAGLTRELRRGEFEFVNCGGSRNVALAAIATGTSRETRPTLVSVSSLAGSGSGPKATASERANSSEIYGGRRLRRESDPLRPLSPYGRSKHSAELALQGFADELNISIVRPPYVFGEGDMLSLALFRMAKRKGVFVLPGWRDSYYSFVYVDDLVDVLRAVAARGERLTQTSFVETDGRCSGVGAYFATAPKPMKFADFGVAIGRAFGRARTIVFRVPPVGVLGTGIYGECYKLACHRFAPLDWNKAIEALRGFWICSGAKAQEQLGITIDEDLQPKIDRVARWYEEANLL